MTTFDLIKTVGIPIIVAFFTAFFTFLYTKEKLKLDISQEYNKKFNLNRWDVYLKFINLISVAIHVNTQSANVLDEMKFEKIFEIDQKVILLGSQELIKSYGEWKVQQHMEGSSGYQTILCLTSVVNNMRKDLGEQGILTKEQILDILHPGWQRTLE